MPTPPPVVPQNENTQAMKEGKLPEKRETIDEDTVKPVEYGSGKESGQASGQRTGTSSLLIDPNTGGNAGGMNV